MRDQSVNLIPSLYVDRVWRTKSASLILRKRSRSMMGGIVASPTPTVPMSGDSMTVMTAPVPGSARANILAAIQPAVPPPTIAMRFICPLSGESWSDMVIEAGSCGEKGPPRRPEPDMAATRGRLLEFTLQTDEESASAFIISKWQVRPLQIRVLHRVRQVLEREEHADVLVVVVANLPVELAVWRGINLVELVFAGLVRDRERGADQRIVDCLIPVRI